MKKRNKSPKWTKMVLEGLKYTFDFQSFHNMSKDEIESLGLFVEKRCGTEYHIHK